MGGEPNMTEDCECAICFLNYDRGARAPRLLSCRHALCTCCVRELLRLDLARAVTRSPRRRIAPPPRQGAVECPFCRAVTCPVSAAEAMPLDLGLWEKLNPDCTTALEEEVGASDRAPPPPAGKWKAWRTLKAAWKGRSGGASARGTRIQGLGDNDMRDLALMTCYII